MNMTRILFLVLGVLAVGLFIRLWAGSGSYPDIWNLRGQIETQNAANDQQVERNQKLQMDVNGLAKDDEAIEDHARSELGMVKQGETFYQVILKTDPKTSSTVLPSPTKESAHVE
jgi:cell division protein FtsB